MPSQIVVDMAARNAAGSAARKPEDGELRQIAYRLLEVGSPPSLLPLFSDASNIMRQVLERLAQLPRTVSYKASDGLRTARIIELAAKNDLHHRLVAPPGSGKTHALWHAARQMLDAGGLIPLFIELRELATWKDVVEAVAEIGDGIDAEALFRDQRVCVILDGWSEFARGRGYSERSRAMRVMNGTRVISSARRVLDSDIIFRIWTLDPLPTPVVRKAIATALPQAPLPSPALLELLRLPLALSLFILLSGSALSRGDLLSHLHAHLSRDLPERFLDVLSGAVASVSLSGERSYVRLRHGILDRARQASLTEPLNLLAQLETLEDRAGHVLPIHGLYWSWLCGLGLLGENRIGPSLRDLSTRESYQLALEGGARASISMVSRACEVDIDLAGVLHAGLDTQTDDGNVFLRSIRSAFADEWLPVRCHAAPAGLQSGDSSLVLPSLNVLTEMVDANLYVPALAAALDPRKLFPNRGKIGEWVGANGTDLLIEAIAARGGPEWGAWLEQLAHSGKLEPCVAAAGALGCDARVSAWVVQHLPRLVSTQRLTHNISLI
jgi:hypothetical protein